MTDQKKKTTQERLSDGYAASTPIKKPRHEPPHWPGKTRDDPEEIERIRASLNPTARMSVGYRRIEKESKQ